jgi:hypothetical protein
MKKLRRYSPRSRDLFASATAVVTGLAAFGVVAATGLASSAAARSTERHQAAQAKARAQLADRLARPDTTLRIPVPILAGQVRRYRTVVRTRVVHKVAAATFVPAAPTSSGSTGGYYPPQAPAPVRPPVHRNPPPAPAPSSGS